MPVNSEQNSLKMLFARLRHPIPMVRWQVAKQIEKLLRDPQSFDATREILLRTLKSYSLESEAANLVAIIWAFNLSDIVSHDDIRENCSAPSLLTDFLPSFEQGFATIEQDTIGNHCGLAPGWFDTPEYFLKMFGRVLPPIHHTQIEALEKRSGLPFIKQWSWEWHQLNEEHDIPYPNTPYFYLDRSDGIKGGHFDVRQREIMISGYLRTLSFAVSVWKMPTKLALEEALNLVPLTPQLCESDIQPTPQFAKDLSAKISAEWKTQAVLEHLTNAQRGTPDIILLNANIPINDEENWCLDIALKGFIFIKHTNGVRDDELSRHFHANKFSTSLSEYRTNIVECDYQADELLTETDNLVAIPVTLPFYPQPLGRWHVDCFSAQINLPVPQLIDLEQLTLIPRNGLIDISNGNRAFAQWLLWASNWQSGYKENGRTPIGTCTTSNLSFIQTLEKQYDGQFGYIVHIKKWSRTDSIRDFEYSESYGCTVIRSNNSPTSQSK